MNHRLRLLITLLCLQCLLKKPSRCEEINHLDQTAWELFMLNLDALHHEIRQPKSQSGGLRQNFKISTPTSVMDIATLMPKPMDTNYIYL